MSEVRYPITSRFLNQESFREKAHLGLDFAMPKDTPLRTIENGVIEKVINIPDGIGKAVYVRWVDGKTAIYGHMNDITVRIGDTVKIGDLLGYSGNTGNVVGENGGYHLHFALMDQLGRYIDPEPYAPFIQEMNHDLINTIANSGNGLISIDSGNVSDVLQNVMKQFVETLQEMDVNMIVGLFNSTSVM